MNLEITIITATYNRAIMLPVLYQSLTKQKEFNFEWIIVDDQSSDDTENVINGFKKRDNNFDIHFIKKTHGGKHRAVNEGVKHAKGKYIFIVDSDDSLLPNATSKISNWISANDDNEKLAGFSGKRIYHNGTDVGTFPNIKEDSYVDVGNTQRYRKHLIGDKAEIYRKEVLMKYPFPEYENEDFVTERMCWDKISYDGFLIRWYNTPIYVCEYQEGGLSKTGANSLNGHKKNHKGYSEFIKQSMEILEPAEAVTYFREYNATEKQLNRNIKERAINIEFSVIKYLYYYFIKVPFWYFIRVVMSVFGII